MSKWYRDWTRAKEALKPDPAPEKLKALAEQFLAPYMVGGEIFIASMDYTWRLQNMSELGKKWKLIGMKFEEADLVEVT
jgi:hypothetical protein